MAVRRWINILSQHTDILVAIGVITILAVMILPLPTFVLDFLLT
ncbi:MAG: flagellar biosynthesis component FlhA, partial [Planctomycetota bacterium]